MTRGTIMLIMNHVVYYTDEFNGDMYLSEDGAGSRAFSSLCRCGDRESFDSQTHEFNDEYFGYEGFEIHSSPLEDFFEKDRVTIDFSRDYFGRFFSDYIFLKNKSVNTINLKLRDKSTWAVVPGATTAVHFGKDIVKKTTGVDKI